MEDSVPPICLAAGGGCTLKLDEIFEPRSLLFVPGGNAKMIEKAAQVGADAIVVDLEDAVAPAEKDESRRTTIRVTSGLDPIIRGRVFVRVNPALSRWFSEDVSVVAASGLAGVVLPKFDSQEALELLHGELQSLDRSDARIIVGIETLRGVHDCYELLKSGVDGAYFGAEDFVADLGGRRTGPGSEVLYARSRLSMSAHLRGVPVIDQAVVKVHDEERFRLDAHEGRALGFCGKLCLHPLQVELANEIFSPSDEEIEHARRVLEVARSGVGTVNGEMVDEVHVRMARAIIAKVSE